MTRLWTFAMHQALHQLVDVFIPAVPPTGKDPVTDAHLARRANDLGIGTMTGGLIDAALTLAAGDGLREFLQGLHDDGFADLDENGRLWVVQTLWDQGGTARHRLRTLRYLAMVLFYGLPTEPDGTNHNWPAIGYPGPPALARDRMKETGPALHEPGRDEILTADVCVVGSGAGGGVIAGVLAEAGYSVVVLERGDHHTADTLDQREIPSYLRLWLDDGLALAEDGSISFLGGETLGGGTTINFMVALPPPADVRAEWAKLGLTGLDGPDFDADLQIISDAIGVNTTGTVHNRTNQLLRSGAGALGRDAETLPRNCTNADDPEVCGFCAWGCPLGAKQTTAATWLRRAAEAGARIVVRAEAETILTEDGRATGVLATVVRPDATRTSLRVRAPTVVAAAGALNTPALLLRSGFGGPAVGRTLRVHPIVAVNGIYDEPVQGWRGQIMSAADRSFARIAPAHGFLIETLGIFPAFWAACLPWQDGVAHKELMQALPWMAPFVAVIRDHGHGTVTIDEDGSPRYSWSLTDPSDRAMAVRAHQEMARIHHAAGARHIVSLHQTPVAWERGESFDGFLDRLAAAPYGPNDLAISSAHAQGSCPMGTDPQTSVADGRGQLHDVRGVWIGDGSGFPTAVGVNPMVTIMALAHRTARAIAETVPVRTEA